MAESEECKDWPRELLDPEQYRIIRQKVIRYLAANRCYNPEELADETFSRVLRKIDSWQSQNVAFGAFLFGFAKIVARERGHGVRGEEQLDDSSPEIIQLAGASWIPDTDPQAEVIEYLQHCLQEMEPEERELIVNYYQGGSQEGDLKRGRQQLADQLGLSIKALRQRAMRLRIKLETEITQRIETRLR